MPVGDHPAPGWLWVVQLVCFLLIYLAPVTYTVLFAAQASLGGRQPMVAAITGYGITLLGFFMAPFVTLLVCADLINYLPLA